MSRAHFDYAWHRARVGDTVRRGCATAGLMDQDGQRRPSWRSVPAAGLAEPCRPGRGALQAEETGIPMAITGRLLPGAATHCHLPAPWWMAGTDLLHVISEKS